MDWLSELVSAPTKEYLHFEAALSFVAVLPPDDAVMLLNQRVQALEILLAQQRGVRRAAEDKGLPRLFLLEDEYVSHLLEAELDWVRKLVKDIGTGALDGLDGWWAWADGDRNAVGDWDADPSLTPHPRRRKRKPDDPHHRRARPDQAVPQGASSRVRSAA